MTTILKTGLQVLSTSVEPTNNSILLQLGDNLNSDAESQLAQLVYPLGFYSLPLPAVSGGAAAEATVLQGFGKRDLVIGIRDIRSQQPGIEAGETMVSAPGSKAKTLYKIDGSIVHYTEDSSGQMSSLYNGPDKIQLSNAFGSLTLDQNGWTLSVASGQGGITISPAGQVSISGLTLSIGGNIVSVAGSMFTCIGANATPVPGTNAILGIAGIDGFPSQNVYIGA